MSHTCIVQNQTGMTISNVSVQKYFADSPDGAITAQIMTPNSTISFNFTGGSGSGDYWSISFMGANGTTYYRNRKRCDVEQEDLNSPTPIYLNFLAPENGFSIEMPSSSSCTDNSYDT